MRVVQQVDNMLDNEAQGYFCGSHFRRRQAQRHLEITISRQPACCKRSLVFLRTFMCLRFNSLAASVNNGQ